MLLIEQKCFHCQKKIKIPVLQYYSVQCPYCLVYNTKLPPPAKPVVVKKVESSWDMEMTKKELQEIAEQKGIHTNSRMTKSQIIDLLDAHE